MEHLKQEKKKHHGFHRDIEKGRNGTEQEEL